MRQPAGRGTTGKARVAPASSPVALPCMRAVTEDVNCCPEAPAQHTAATPPAAHGLRIRKRRPRFVF
jgi:hypothetical protein